MFSYRIDDRLELRILEERHAQELFDLIVANREHLRRWLVFADTTEKVEDTLSFIRKSLDRFAAGDGFNCGIWQGGRIIGTIGLLHIRRPADKTEIGYWLAEAEQNKGIMTRCVRAMCDLLFGDMKLNRVEIQCASENRRSRAVPERLGFTQEGVLRDSGRIRERFVDHVVYSMLAREWKR
jgi:ribosomal-protein-serine acetyltransferase